MRLKHHLVKFLMAVLILGPLAITSCSDDDDGNEPKENQESKKPPKGQSDMSSEEKDIPMPDSVYFFDSSNYVMRFRDTGKQSLIVNGGNDSVSITIAFYRNTGSGKIQPGTYECDDFASGNQGVHLTVYDEGDIWSSYTSRISDNELGNVEIISRSDNNVYAKLNDATLRAGNNVTSTFKINGRFNASSVE